jgi:hypothetical protein
VKESGLDFNVVADSIAAEEMSIKSWFQKEQQMMGDSVFDRAWMYVLTALVSLCFVFVYDLRNRIDNNDHAMVEHVSNLYVDKYKFEASESQARQMLENIDRHERLIRVLSGKPADTLD